MLPNPEGIIQEVIGRYLDPEKSFIFLFGSRAGENYQPASDYDVGVYTGQKIPLSVIAQIKDQLEDYPIPVDVDIVDFSSVSEEFRRLATSQVRIWNRPKKGSPQNWPF